MLMWLGLLNQNIFPITFTVPDIFHSFTLYHRSYIQVLLVKPDNRQSFTGSIMKQKCA